MLAVVFILLERTVSENTSQFLIPRSSNTSVLSRPSALYGWVGQTNIFTQESGVVVLRETKSQQ